MKKQEEGIDLKAIYNQVLKMKGKDLDEAVRNAESEEEKQFYVKLYNYKLASRQKEIVNKKEFTI